MKLRKAVLSIQNVKWWPACVHGKFCAPKEETEHLVSPLTFQWSQAGICVVSNFKMELESDNSADFMDDEEPGVERFDDKEDDDFIID
jgi:hypothetical protein